MIIFYLSQYRQNYNRRKVYTIFNSYIFSNKKILKSYYRKIRFEFLVAIRFSLPPIIQYGFVVLSHKLIPPSRTAMRCLEIFTHISYKPARQRFAMKFMQISLIPFYSDPSSFTNGEDKTGSDFGLSSFLFFFVT